MSTYADILERLQEENTEAILWTGLEKALIGTASSFGKLPIAVYDYDLCIEILKKDMTEDEAIEYFEYNTFGAYLGEFTPLTFKK